MQSEKEIMEWIATSEQHPKRDEAKKYSQVPCLVNKRYDYEREGEKLSYYQIQILVFNHEHECWDGEDGDDYDCEIDRVTHWMHCQKLQLFPSQISRRNERR